MSDSVVVSIEGLTKTYDDGTVGIDDLVLDIYKGEIFGLLGPNGAGKTTTIKLMMGHMHQTSGVVIIQGHPAGIDGIEARSDIGYIPGKLDFYDNLTALQTIEFFCALKKVDKSRAPELLRTVGLADAMHRKIGAFSKGMRQLLAFAQAMIGNPSLYIFDEPMDGLDARWVKEVRDTILRLNDEGATIIFSSHILSEVQNICHRVAIIDHAKLIAIDTVDRLNFALNLRPRLDIVIPGLGGAVPAGVNRIRGVETVSASGDTLSIICSADERAHIIAALVKKQLDIQDIKTIEPSLEEAFMKIIDNGGT